MTMTYADAMNKAEIVNARNDDYRAVVIRIGAGGANDKCWDIEVSRVTII